MQTIYPAPEAFARAYAQARAQLVWTQIPADLYTPVGVMLRLARQPEPCFLLESVEKGETRGRYSVIGLMPDVTWRCFGRRAEIATHGGAFTPCPEESLTAFRALLAASRLEIPEGLPPMSAGLVGYMGYDMVKCMERLPDALPDTVGIPDACFIRPQVMAIFDAVADRLYLTTPVWKPEGKVSADDAYAQARARLQRVFDLLASPLPETESSDFPAVRLEDFASNTPRERYDAMIRQAIEHIRAGDIFQVVLSQRFSAPFALPPLALYRSLRYLNPSPFLFYLNFRDFQLVGSSPEILVRLRGERVTIRPIAGTRRRGKDREEDAALAGDLLADPKEIAEHLMLLDLGRNDVGRVAKTGTVRTTQKMEIEHYSHVMHIVSNVEGEIDRARFDAIGALVAGFPAGTVSGAPKIRAMEIIEALEVHRRSFYAGCVGYFSAGGDMDTCITLRTGLVKDGMLHIQAGGGIVADSNAEAEYQESLNKAKALMRAAEEAVNFL
ncbi:MAG: anthranilate synthase component I [Alphaproteobacteria bacterium]|nr:anthranilate synthase component I [Alphaproteobacteria bacterium]